jgi:hypothetical protein
MRATGLPAQEPTRYRQDNPGLAGATAMTEPPLTMQVRLEARDGSLLTYARLPQMYEMPDIVFWDGGIFTNHRDFFHNGVPIYREAIMVTVVEPTPRMEL